MSKPSSARYKADDKTARDAVEARQDCPFHVATRGYRRYCHWSAIYHREMADAYQGESSKFDVLGRFGGDDEWKKSRQSLDEYVNLFLRDEKRNELAEIRSKEFWAGFNTHGIRQSFRDSQDTINGD